MSATVFHRPPRMRPPEMPSGELSLQEPPVLSEQLGSGSMSMLPMMIGGGAMALMVGAPLLAGSGGSFVVMLAPLGMGVMMMSMMFSSRGGNDRRGKIRGERRDYLRYLGQMRKQVRSAAADQRSALAWRHPDPQSLWSVAMSGRLWERRAAHPDFAEVRIALGPQRLALTLKPIKTKPIEDLEPLSARALRRFIAAYGSVGGLPSAVFMRGFAHVQFRGDVEAARANIRAVLGQLITFHSPDDLVIAVCADKASTQHWDWVKWLPHSQHRADQDGAGATRLVADDIEALNTLLLASLDERGRFEPGATPSREVPYVVIVLDGVTTPPESRMAGAGFDNTLVDLDDGRERRPGGPDHAAPGHLARDRRHDPLRPHRP